MKKEKRLFYGLIIIIIMILSLPVSNSMAISALNFISTNPERIKLDKENIQIEPQKTAIIIATVEPENVTDRTVTYSSSNPDVATVDDNGTITAKKEGTANITATTVNGKTAICKVTVKKPEIEVTEVKLNKTSISLEKGKTEQLKVTISPSNANNKTVTWSSSNSKIAKVENGKVTAVAAGKATIIAKTSNGKEAKCSVSVIENINFNVTANKEIKSEYLRFKSTKTTVQKIKLGKGSAISLANLMKKTTNATSATWTSENSKIATVSSSGVVKGIAKGTTKITALSNNGYKATLNVEVVNDGYDLFYDSNGKIITDTNTILTILGKTDSNYYMRVHVGKNKSYNKITLTVYAPDVNGNYQIPVRSCLIGIASYFWENSNKWRDDLHFGMCNSTAAEWSDVPGCWTPYRIGFIWGYFHSIPYKKDGSGYAYGYNNQGTCVSAGCERLFWQDLAWIYYHCDKKNTYCKFIAEEDPGPFGVGYKYPTSTSKWPGYTKAEQLYGKNTTPIETTTTTPTTTARLNGLSTNYGPRYSLSTTKSDKVVINLIDDGGISSVKLEKYVDKKYTDITKDITVSKDKKTVTLSKKLIGEAGSSAQFRLSMCDTSSKKCNTIAIFTIKVLSEKDENNNYFTVNNAPRLRLSLKDYDYIRLSLTDLTGINLEKLEIKDNNNNNKTISYKIEENKGTNISLLIKRTDLTKKSEKYYLTIKALDKSGQTIQQEIETKALCDVTVKKGSNNMSVKYLQQCLNDIGEDLEVDGYFGSVTQTAVKEFQKAYKLEVDGVVGEQTWGKLLDVVNSEKKASDDESDKKDDTDANKGESKTVNVTGVTLNKNKMNLEVGKTEQLKATITPSNATNKTVTWSSSNSKIAKVENGKVTAVKEGTCTITVETKDGGKKATCKVTVSKKEVVDKPGSSSTESYVNIYETTKSLKSDDNNYVTYQLTGFIMYNGNKESLTSSKVSWKSSNTKLATVNNGKITVMKNVSGTVTITAAITVQGKTYTDSVKVVISHGDSVNITAETVAIQSDANNYVRHQLNGYIIYNGNKESLTSSKVSWRSSNTKLATVNNGKITVMKNVSGTVTITAAITVQGKTYTDSVEVRIFK